MTPVPAPSTTMWLKPSMLRQPFQGQTGSLKLAPGANLNVMGRPGAPDPWTVIGVVIVPHRVTTVPAPTFVDPEPQFPASSSHDGDFALAQLPTKTAWSVCCTDAGEAAHAVEEPAMATITRAASVR